MKRIMKISELVEKQIVLIHMLSVDFNKAAVYEVIDITHKERGDVVVQKIDHENGGTIDQYTLNVSYRLFSLDETNDPEYFL